MAGKWKRRSGVGGDGKKKLLVSGLSLFVLVLAVFGRGRAGGQPPGTFGKVSAELESVVQVPGAAAGSHACSVLYACGEMWFPAAFERLKSGTGKEWKSRGEGLSCFLAEHLMEGFPWYGAAKGGKTAVWEELDPAYRSYQKKQRQAEEYSRLADCLSHSRILSDSGLLAEDGSHSACSSSEPQAESSSPPALSAALSMGTTAGQRLLKRADLPVTGKTYLSEQLADYDYIMKHFYTVHPTAAAGRDMIQAETFLAKDFSLKQEADDGKPQILIYHSHSQEEFADYHTGNKEATIVGVGEYLAQLLEKKGYQVLHDTSVYDLRSGTLDRNKAYSYALEGVERILKEYPSIEVILDIHRDGVGSGTRLVQEVNGKPSAQIMFFNGTSQTPDGPISYLENPNREDNLAFSFQMKLCADAFYPGYARNIYLKGLRYNLHLRPRSALVEVGAQTNTYEEAKNAMEPLAELLDIVLGSGE